MMLIIGASGSENGASYASPPRFASVSIPPAPRVPGVAVRRLYPRTLLLGDSSGGVVRFPPLCGSHIEDPRVNDSQTLNLDAACVTILSLDLLALFGIMACPACRRIPVRDILEFSDWLHVISVPIVVWVFAGSTNERREAFKAFLVDTLWMGFGLTLTCAADSLTLSTSHVNVPVPAMYKALYTLIARICRVSFFGMKWFIPGVEPAINSFIERYHAQMDSSVPTGRNMFDYGAR